jgi:LPS-assembly lipoprotein
MKRRVLLASSGLAVLAGCGFQLRQAPEFAFDSLVINAPASSPFAAELRRALDQQSRVQVLGPGAVAQPAAAGASAAVPPPGRIVFDLLQEQREKVVVGLNASGQVREYQLRSRLQFRVRTPQGRELIPVTELLQSRDMSFSESLVLAKESEETLLYRDMQSDLVQQLMRRLAALPAV